MTMIAMSACFGCKRIFSYDPDTVPSIQIDHDSGLSPDLGGNPDKAVREPICPSCCKRVNPERIARGFEPFPEHDTACYDR